MHERYTATEKEFDILIQMTLEYVPARRSKQITAKLANINKYV